MKAITTPLAFFALLILISCGKGKEVSVDEVIENNDKKELQALKDKLYHQQRDLSLELEKVDEALAAFEDKSRYTLIEAQNVQKKDFRHYIKVQGNVTTDENLLIYPEFSGVLEKIYVREGDRVNKGQLLATINDGGAQNQLAEMKAQRDLAKTRFERQERLWNQNIGSEIQFLEAQTTYEQLNNSVKQMQSQLNKSEIRAPFNGVVDEVIIDQGQVVSPSQNAIFRIVNLQEMYVQANVPETYVGSINQGSRAIVQLRALGVELDTQINRVSSHIEDSNRNFRVRLNLPDSIPNLKPNLIATLKINDYTNEEVVVIPENILQETAAGEFYVYVLKDIKDNTATATYNQVVPGRNYRGEIEILEGLSADDRIVTEGARTLKRGEKVSISTTEK